MNVHEQFRSRCKEKFNFFLLLLNYKLIAQFLYRGVIEGLVNNDLETQKKTVHTRRLI